jgi:hypothetical protein
MIGDAKHRGSVESGSSLVSVRAVAAEVPPSGGRGHQSEPLAAESSGGDLDTDTDVSTERTRPSTGTTTTNGRRRPAPKPPQFPHSAPSTPPPRTQSPSNLRRRPPPDPPCERRVVSAAQATRGTTAGVVPPTVRLPGSSYDFEQHETKARLETLTVGGCEWAGGIKGGRGV